VICFGFFFFACPKGKTVLLTRALCKLTAILSLSGIVGWPDLIPTLTTVLDHPNRDASLGALLTLQKICEDHYEASVFLCSVFETICIVFSLFFSFSDLIRIRPFGL
jgi:hypothetical protein